MARKGSVPTRRSSNLSLEQMRAAIPMLETRVKELREFDPKSISKGNDPPVQALSARIMSTLSRIYGEDTLEFARLREAAELDDTMYTGAFYIGPGSGPIGPSVQEIREGVARGRNRAIALLDGEISSLRETLGPVVAAELASPAARALRAYEGLDLHPEISRAVSGLYHDGHYANAVEDAVKALNGLVRLRSGLEVDGVTLMQRTFSPNGPILKFNDLSDQSDRDEQLGFMNMFSSAVSGLRNPRAHGFIHDDPERALEFIAFVSLLAKLLDEAKKV